MPKLKEIVIQCPACDSEITPDGKKLVKRSKLVTEYDKLKADLAELEKEIEKLENAEAARKEREAKKNVELGEGKDKDSVKGSTWFRRGSR
jgi:outer membrane murein-binding lipoprotein Lpp